MSSKKGFNIILQKIETLPAKDKNAKLILSKLAPILNGILTSYPPHEEDVNELSKSISELQKILNKKFSQFWICGNHKIFI